MFRKFVFTFMATLLLSVLVVSAVFAAGQEKATVCHKPGTADEVTLEIGARAAAAHLAHGDYSGPCQAAPTATPPATSTPVVTSTPVATSTPPATPTPTPANGCAALNALVADPQTSSTSYYFGTYDQDFNPGDQIHVYATFTSIDTASYDATFAELILSDSIGSELAYSSGYASDGASATASVDYVVVAGDDADAFSVYITTDGFGTMTLNSVHISCTPA